MVSLSFHRSNSFDPDLRRYSQSSWQSNSIGSGISRSRLSQSGNHERLTSPSPARSFQNYTDRSSLSEKLDRLQESLSGASRYRRYSVSGLRSTTADYSPNNFYGQSSNYSSLIPSSDPKRRSYSQIANDRRSYSSFYDNTNSDKYQRQSSVYSSSSPSWNLNSRSFSRSADDRKSYSGFYDNSNRLSSLPSAYNGDGLVSRRSNLSRDLPQTFTRFNYGNSNNFIERSKDIKASGYRRLSYATNFDSPTFVTSYTPSRSYYSSLASSPTYYDQERSRSLSRYSYPKYSSRESYRNLYPPVASEPPIQSRILNILNKYSSRIYENKSSQSTLNYPNASLCRECPDKESYRSSYGYDNTKEEIDKNVYNILEDLTGRKNSYARQLSRRSSLLTPSYNVIKSSEVANLEDSLDASFNSIPRQPMTGVSIAKPYIKIENVDYDVYDDHDHVYVDSHVNDHYDDNEGDISSHELAKLFKSDKPEDIAKLVLNGGERFHPDEISTTILPTGEKALVMRKVKQTAAVENGGGLRTSLAFNPATSSFTSGNTLSPDSEQIGKNDHVEHEWANKEIDNFTQLTEEFEGSLQTLEHFIAKNRCLFPENLIIYQRITYYKSTTGGPIEQDTPSAKTRLSFVDDGDVCAVKIREKLVLPHYCRKNGYDIVELLRRCYPRYDEIEVVYDDEENIKEKLLRQEKNKLDPFEEGSDKPTKPPKRTNLDVEITSEVDSGRNSPLYIDEEELLQKCRHAEDCPPYFTTRPRPQLAAPGQSIRFTCSIAGNPEPEVNWFKNGRPIPKDGRFSATNNFGICSMRINSVKPEDQGMYKVQLRNYLGSLDAEIDFSVMSTEPPQIRKTSDLAFTLTPPYYVHMTEGDPLSLKCYLQGQRTPEVTWYREKKELSNGPKHRVTAADWRHVLQINRLELSDAGIYTVVADDGITTLKHTVEVNVIPKKNHEDDTVTEYEIVKKMGHIKMPPMFVKPLPLHSRVKEGENLVIGCEVDETESQPYVMGVEIVEKKRKISESIEQQLPHDNSIIPPDSTVIPVALDSSTEESSGQTALEDWRKVPLTSASLHQENYQIVIDP